MELRDADSDDATRIHELAQSTMTSAYALSPQQLDTIAAERFDAGSLEQAIGDDETVLLVAENSDDGAADGDTIVGFVEGRIDGDRGELRWLFVDPEHRGMGIGTQLYEAGGERLRENGIDDVRATVLDANTEGGTFFERLELERVDEHEIEIGSESFVEYVYADPSAVGSSETAESGAEDTDRADESEIEDAGDDLPRTEKVGDSTLATAEDGTETYLDREEIESGTEGPFVVAYTDEDLTDRYGYYCSNCGSLDTAVDESERIECADCGNTHAERSAEAYDDSYL